MISECVMSLIILMLVNGWYTRYKNYNIDEGLENYAPFFILCVFVHILFATLSYVDQDAYHKYHDFHGWVGYLVICGKLSLIAAFFYFYSYANDKINKESRPFYDQIVIIGLIFLLSDPFAIMSSFFLEEYNRQFYNRFCG